MFSVGLWALSATGCCQLLCENGIQPDECRQRVVQHPSMVGLVAR